MNQIHERFAQVINFRLYTIIIGRFEYFFCQWVGGGGVKVIKERGIQTINKSYVCKLIHSDKLFLSLNLPKSVV